MNLQVEESGLAAALPGSANYLDSKLKERGQAHLPDLRDI
jgi:hypothetical protein